MKTREQMSDMIERPKIISPTQVWSLPPNHPLSPRTTTLVRMEWTARSLLLTQHIEDPPLEPFTCAEDESVPLIKVY